MLIPSFSVTCRRRRRAHLWPRAEPRLERATDLKMAEQEHPLVESPSAQPAGDLVVALAGVARSAGRHHVVERVAAPAGDREHTVALQATVGRVAVRTATPCVLERHPLFGSEIVLDTLHPAPPPSSGTFPTSPADSHPATVRRAAGPRVDCRAFTATPDHRRLRRVGSGVIPERVERYAACLSDCGLPGSQRPPDAQRPTSRHRLDITHARERLTDNSSKPPPSSSPSVTDTPWRTCGADSHKLGVSSGQART